MKKTVLITGASRGIGKSLANLFAKDGYDLVLVARNKTQLEQNAEQLKKNYHINAITISKDLSEQNAAQTLFDEITNLGIEIDVLVNNAGIGLAEPFAENEINMVSAMININVLSLTELSRLFLPQMIARKTGKIVNLSSTAAFQPGPGMAVYYASKAYVLSLSQALNYELKNTGVTVTAVCPGPTQTDFFAPAHMIGTNLASGKMGMKTPEQVALSAYRGMKRNKRVVIPGFMNYLASKLVVPTSISMGVVTYLNRKKV